MTETNTDKTEQLAGENQPAEVPAQEQLLTETLVKTFEQSLETEDKKAYEHWGFALFHSLSDEKAQKQLLGLGLKPKDALDFYNVGCVLASEEKFADSAKAFAKAIELKSDFEEAIYNLALAHEKAGNINEARRNWKDLLNLVTDEEELGRLKQHLKELPGA